MFTEIANFELYYDQYNLEHSIDHDIHVNTCKSKLKRRL